ncbi:MAG: hypothetical protein MI866_19405 [Bacteroidales bacterium]|nr:hypothetical protein [Bacteroidales bacterium]
MMAIMNLGIESLKVNEMKLKEGSSNLFYKMAIIFLLFLHCNNMSSQDKQLVATITTSNKNIVFTEGQRVRLKTIDGKKISGKLNIIDNESFFIKNTIIHVDEIIKIKKNPLIISVVTGGILIFTGITLFNAGLIGAVFAGDSSALLATIPGIGLIFIGLPPLIL